MIPDSTAGNVNASNAKQASDARRMAFVDAAQQAFFENGYAGTTMSSIASVVGGSKTTLWTYFPSKQALFEAVIDRLIDQYAHELTTPIPPRHSLPEALMLVATEITTRLLSEPLIALMRLVTGEAGRFPELARIVHDRGIHRGRSRLADYLSAAMEKGMVRTGDPLRAAAQFGALCQSGVYQQTLLGLTAHPTPDQIANDINAAITVFVRAWGLSGHGASKSTIE
jgi:AcrR family transcriptional regulator